MALSKLKALHKWLGDSGLFDIEQLDSWMEDGKLIPRSKNLGADQIQVCQLQYDAIFSIEGFTQKPESLFVLICLWLSEHDSSRDDDKLPAPDIDIDVLDEEQADVEIKVVFKEDIQLIKTAGGAFGYKGSGWDIAPAQVYEADQVAVGDNKEEPTDKPYTYGEDD